MPVGVRLFAEYQLFTPAIEALWGLLIGTPIGNSAILALGWCLVFGLVGYLWARAIYIIESLYGRQVEHHIQPLIEAARCCA
jgi:hypothetical protein